MVGRGQRPGATGGQVRGHAGRRVAADSTTESRSRPLHAAAAADHPLREAWREAGGGGRAAGGPGSGCGVRAVLVAVVVEFAVITLIS